MAHPLTTHQTQLFKNTCCISKNNYRTKL